MPRRWSRRTLLAALATASTAGCVTDSSGSTPTHEPTDRPDDTESPTTRPPAESTTATDPSTTSDSTPEETATTRTTSRSSTTDATTTDATTTEPPATTARGDAEPPSSVDSSWPMPDADPGRTNGVTATGPVDPVAPLWQLATERGLSDPIVADGTVYVGDGGGVRALDAVDGSRRWRQSLGSAASTPSVYDQTLYAPTDDGIAALATSDGSRRWTTETPDRAGMLVASHGVYWIADREPPVVVALSRADGTERWRTEIETPWTARLIASADALFVPSGTHDNRFWTVDPASGEIRGKKPRHGHDFPAEQCYRNDTMYAVDAFFGNVRASPVTDAGNGWSQGVDHSQLAALSAGADRVYYPSNYEGGPTVYALDATHGDEAWTASPPSPISGYPSVASDTVVVPTSDGATCLAPEDGTELWTHESESMGDAFVVVDDLLYTTVEGTLTAFRSVE